MIIHRKYMRLLYYISIGSFIGFTICFLMTCSLLVLRTERYYGKFIQLQKEKHPGNQTPIENPRSLYFSCAKFALACRSDPPVIIYAMTATYARAVQKAELTRLSQTLLHVANFHWIVIDDSVNRTTLVANLLKDSGLNYTHLHIPTPEKRTLSKGALQRNIGLDWLMNNTRKEDRGVVYFADDDNTYDLRIFHEMRSTKIVSVWPVGLTGGTDYEGCIVSDDGLVIGWDVYWHPKRPFAIDMAGFAINLRRLQERPDVRFTVMEDSESVLLARLVKMTELEPKADACTKVYVWHTQTKLPKINSKKQRTRPIIEV